MSHNSAIRFSLPALASFYFAAFPFFLAFFSPAAASTAKPADDPRLKYEAQYQAETDPVHKAKILARLGELEVAYAGTQLNAGEDEASLATLERLRDEVRSAFRELSATGVSAEKHPAGFKELQIGLRGTLRRLDDLIVTVPYDKRPWFQAVRSDIMSVHNSLIEVLFPLSRGSGKGM